MGIKDLHKIIRKFAPNVYEEINLDEYAYEKIAVDVSLYLFKYKASMGNRWLNGFIEMIGVLKNSGVHPVFVYDNKPPQAKEKEKEKRRNTREKMENRVLTLEEDLKVYHENGEVSKNLLEFYQSREKNQQVLRLLPRAGEKSISIRFVENEVEKMRGQMVSISKEDIALTKEMCNALGVPSILAKSEAEKECAEMCKSGKVIAVLSEDTDLLAYGCPIFLTKFSTKSGVPSCTRINYKKLLKTLELTPFSFLDLCIMCGCDYNERIKGVGPMNVYKLIKECGKIENMKKDYTCLNVKTCRSIFKTEEYTKKIPFTSLKNWNKFEEFCLINNVKVNTSRLKGFYKPKIKIVEE